MQLIHDVKSEYEEKDLVLKIYIDRESLRRYLQDNGVTCLLKTLETNFNFILERNPDVLT